MSSQFCKYDLFGIVPQEKNLRPERLLACAGLLYSPSATRPAFNLRTALFRTKRLDMYDLLNVCNIGRLKSGRQNKSRLPEGAVEARQIPNTLGPKVTLCRRLEQVLGVNMRNFLTRIRSSILALFKENLFPIAGFALKDLSRKNHSNSAPNKTHRIEQLPVLVFLGPITALRAKSPLLCQGGCASFHHTSKTLRPSSTTVYLRGSLCHAFADLRAVPVVCLLTRTQ